MGSQENTHRREEVRLPAVRTPFHAKRSSDETHEASPWKQKDSCVATRSEQFDNTGAVTYSADSSTTHHRISSRHISNCSSDLTLRKKPRQDRTKTCPKTCSPHHWRHPRPVRQFYSVSPLFPKIE